MTMNNVPTMMTCSVIRGRICTNVSTIHHIIILLIIIIIFLQQLLLLLLLLIIYYYFNYYLGGKEKNKRETHGTTMVCLCYSVQ